ncbi:hypothetical protein MKX03_031357 [Papaver bracteatum]|nr:hypothetical protein MKX03_031357 [Papaver bracteatum]
MMDNGDVDKNFRPLDLGALPPWQITVTLADGEKQYIKIPYSEVTHVAGLPLGFSTSVVSNFVSFHFSVIASNYKTLLCMVNGMTSIITNLTLKLEQQQKVAACQLDNLDRFHLELLEELTCTVGGGMAVSQAQPSSCTFYRLLFLHPKRKLSTEESGPCDTQAVCIEKLEHLPPPTSNDRPVIPVLLVQQSVIEEDMNESDNLPLTRVKRLRGENVPTSASLSCFDMQTEKVESDAGVLPVREPVDATMTSTSANCLTTLHISIPIDIIPPVVESKNLSGLGEDEGFEDVENLKSDDLPLSSMKHSGSEDVPASASLICSEVKTEKLASVAGALLVWNLVSSRVGDEWFEYVDNFRIPKVYADLYKKILSIYGHMATKKFIRSNDDIILAAVINAETLQFNIKWLPDIFNTLKSSWKSSFMIDKEVESREQVLDATQVEYAGFRSRKDELETELVELKTKIREF